MSTFVTIEFGSQLPVSPEQVVHGSWHLWVELASWRFPGASGLLLGISRRRHAIHKRALGVAGIVPNRERIMSEAFVPKDIEWFIGEIVEEFQTQHDSKNLVFINTILIRADSAELAYDKAMSIGMSSNRVFTNTDGLEVRATFKGLRGLYAIYDWLEDGAELLFEKREGFSNEEIAKIVKSKQQLAVFSPTWE